MLEGGQQPDIGDLITARAEEVETPETGESCPTPWGATCQ